MSRSAPLAIISDHDHPYSAWDSVALSAFSTSEFVGLYRVFPPRK